jgi:predicted nucleotidyltransferase
VHESVDKVVTPFLAAADAALGAGYSALLYGSAARDDYRPGRSDVNLMLVIDDTAPSRLRALGPAFATWRKTRADPPLLINRQEWARASDVFPIEITDMRAGYKVLRGPDPLAGLSVARTDLRRALEAELRGKLLQVRRGYVAAAGSERALAEIATASVGTVLVLLRALLSLVGRAVPPTAAGLAADAAALVGASPTSLATPLTQRGTRGWRCPAADFEQYLQAITRAVEYVDQLQLGDQ